MMSRIALPFVRLFNRWMPDPFIFALLLTLVTFGFAIGAGHTSPIEATQIWGSNIWKLLAFTAQIGMTLITGHVLAHTPIARMLLSKSANLVRTSSSAYLIVGFIAAVGSFINWGIGLIVSAIIAREVASICYKKKIKVHYPLLIATAYSGFVVWHQGLSATIGLSIASPDHLLVEMMGQVPVSQTIFSAWNLTTAAIVILTMPIVMMLLKPKKIDCFPMSKDLVFEDESTTNDTEKHEFIKTPAGWVENSRLLNIIFGLIGLVYIIHHCFILKAGLDLNLVNFTFLLLGILCARSPIHFVNLVSHAAASLGPIMIQFPFYAGIMGLMLDSGVGKLIIDWFLTFSTAKTLPFWSFISSGILNIFVPSGGGGWAIQGPIAAEAALKLNADMARVAMGVAMGDQWTNMIQPFWAIPALSIAGLQVKDIMGYCVISLIWSGLIFSIALLCF